ncbi:unnamed protein product [Symbiodinium sp. CCMP2456]|nr:unnamed protein product [Symbiodinium sp. CCMP2456]
MATSATLAVLARRSLRLAPLLLGILAAELWRWLWRRWARRSLSRPLAIKETKGVHRRPGVDDDLRFQQIEDDPRDLPGAAIGKAQLGARGIPVSGGMNTVSLDPASTFVEPGLRCICSVESDVYSGTICPEDLVVAPDFFGNATDMQMYDKLLVEMQEMTAEKSESEQVMARIREYFRLDRESCTSCLTWHQQTGEPALTVKDPDFDATQGSGRFEAVAFAVFGGSCELRLQRPGNKRDYVAIPCINGALHLMGAAALARWRCERTTWDNWDNGLVSLIILGRPWGMSRRRLAAVPPNPVPLQINLADPLHRPAMRIRVTRQDVDRLSHDDVIVMPEFFGRANDWDAYYTLLREVREGQANGIDQTKWESWHEGAHLLTKNPSCSRAFNDVLDRICDHFSIANGHLRHSASREVLGMRFNWYRDGSDWKPFHHDAAAFNPRMAEKQNCTVGVSFGSSRELAFRNTASGDLLYFPQSNGMLFFFGRDVNIRWQHGLNALPLEQQSGKGRISIILWGLCQLAIEEMGSPPMLPPRDDGKGKGKGKTKDARREPGRNLQMGQRRFSSRPHGNG